MSEQYKADPYAGEKAVFTNEIEDGLKVDIGDTISLHSAYVSSIGAGGEVIEIKGEVFEETYDVTQTSVEIVNDRWDMSASGAYSMPDGKLATHISVSNVSLTTPLKDNEVKMEIEFYKTTNGRNYFKCPRRFDKAFPETIPSSAANASLYVERNYYTPFPTSYTTDGLLVSSAPATIHYAMGNDTGAPYVFQGCVQGDAGSFGNWNKAFLDNYHPHEFQHASASDYSGAIVGPLNVNHSDVHNCKTLNNDEKRTFRGATTGPPIPDNGHETWEGVMFNSFSNLLPENENQRYTIFIQDGENFYTPESFLSGSNAENYTNIHGNKFIGTRHGGTCVNVSGTFLDAGKSQRDRPPWTYKYVPYKEVITLTAETGFDTPSNIGNDLTNQMTEILKQPQRITGTSKTPLDNKLIVADSQDISIKTESPFFKLFRASNPKYYSKQGWLSYANGCDTTGSGDISGSGAQSASGLNYNNCFQFIGVKRPDLFMTGRDIHGEYTVSSASLSQFPSPALDPLTGYLEPANSASATSGLCGGQHFQLLKHWYPAPFSGSYATDAANGAASASSTAHTDYGNASHLLITDKYWDESLANASEQWMHGKPLRDRLSKLFQAQKKYPELFEYPNYFRSDDEYKVYEKPYTHNVSQTSINRDRCRFLHMGANSINASWQCMVEGHTGTRGTRTANAGGFTSNYGYLGNDYWSNSDKWATHNCSVNQASTPVWICYNEDMVGKYGEGRDSIYNTDLGEGFAVKYINPNDGLGYLAFATTSHYNQWINLTPTNYGAFGFCKANASWNYDPTDPLYSTWGPVYGAQGMPMCFRGRPFGWDYSANAYGCPVLGLYTGQLVLSKDMTPADASTSTNVIAEGTNGEDRFRSSDYINQIYLGADSPILNYDSVGNRFSISDLHTMERLSQPYNSGYDQQHPIISDAENKVYKLNPRISGYTYCPDMMPYETRIVESNTSATIIQMNKNLTTGVIYDAHCGVALKNFGISREDWKKSLWNTLGFTFEQLNSSGLSGQIRLNDTKTPNMDGITTNAKVLQSDIQNYSVNYYGATMYDDLLPIAKTTYALRTRPMHPAIEIDQKSIAISAENLPIKSTRPYYLIQSDIIPADSYRGAKGNLPVVAIATKINGYQDAYSQDGTQLSFTATKPFVINTITTRICDPDGTLARVDDYSGVIYKVTKQISAQMDLSEYYTNILQAKAQQSASNQEMFFSNIAQMSAQQFFKEEELNRGVAFVPPNPFAEPETIEEIRDEARLRHDQVVQTEAEALRRDPIEQQVRQLAGETEAELERIRVRQLEAQQQTVSQAQEVKTIAGRPMSQTPLTPAARIIGLNPPYGGLLRSVENVARTMTTLREMPPPDLEPDESFTAEESLPDLEPDESFTAEEQQPFIAGLEGLDIGAGVGLEPEPAGAVSEGAPLRRAGSDPHQLAALKDPPPAGRRRRAEYEAVFGERQPPPQPQPPPPSAEARAAASAYQEQMSRPLREAQQREERLRKNE